MPTRDPRLPQPSAKKRKPKKPAPQPLSEHALDARRKPAPPPPPPPQPVSEHAMAAVAKRQQPKADPQVISRQRLLRAHGYGVVVDGIWGPASQAAWTDYTRKQARGPASPVVAHRHGEQAAATVHQIHTKQLARQATERAQVAARRAAEQARVTAATGSERKAIARANRESPRLAAAVQNAARHREDVLPAQRALRKLHAQRTTAEALVQEKAKAIHVATVAATKRPEDLTTHELVALTVDPLTGHFNPQNHHDVVRVQRWLKAHGHPEVKVDGDYGEATNAALVQSLNHYHQQQEERARQLVVNQLYKTNTIKPGDRNFPVLGVAPKPGELLHLLRAGGFTASLVLNALLQKALAPGPRFLTWREQELRRLTKRLYGPFQTPGFITSGHAAQVAQQIAADPRFKLDATGHSVGAEQVLALADSRSPQEFGQRLDRINAQAEARFHAAQADHSKDHRWWGAGVLDVLSAPSDWLSTQIEVMGADAVYIYHHPDAIFHLQRSEEENRVIDQSVAEFQASHPWLNLGLQMAADPLWFVPGVNFGKLGSLTARAAVRAEQLGFTLSLSAHGTVAFKAIDPVAGLLVLPAATGRATRDLGLALAHGTTPLARLTQVDHLVNFAKLATAQKTEMLGRVRSQLRQGRRQLFRDRPGAPKFRQLTGGKARAEIDKLADLLLTDTHATLPELHRVLRQHFISLASDEAWTADSNVGGMLFARVADGLRTLVVQRIAAEEALDRAAQRLAQLDLRHLPADATLGDKLAALPPKVREEILTDLKRGYRSVIRRSGTYFAGGGEPILNKMIDETVEPALDRLRAVISVVQHDLEDAADRGGYRLFDDAGKWGGRTTGASELLRNLGRAAYDDNATLTLRNSNHALPDGTLRYFDRDTFEQITQSELRRYSSHLRGFAARENAAGRPRSKDWIEGKMNERKRELERAWTFDKELGWHDTRETLEVPSIYLRASARLYRDAPVGLLERDDLPESLLNLSSIAVNPVEAVGNKLDTELEKFAFALVGHSPHVRELADVLNFPALRDFAVGTEHASLGDNAARLDEALSRAHDVALPKQMARNFALWQALLHAQSKPLRFAGKAASAWLDVWLTATLPFRPGFVVRNVVDNTVKSLVAGARDPRYYFPLRGAQAVRSVFDIDLGAIRYILSAGGRFQQNPALHYFDRVLNSFWEHEPEIIQKVFDAHAIPIPREVVDGLRQALPEAGPIRAVAAIRNKLWDLMAARPENAARRALYRATFQRELDAGATQQEAFEKAIANVKHTLFDYGEITVIEDNLRFIFTFAQFWRKTAQFWITESFDKPWLPVEFALFEDRMQNDLHADWPDWMRRYVHTDLMTDALAKVPGLKWLLPGLQAGAITDPANFFSFNVLYRTFKNENPNLPADKAGWAFLAPFVDALNDWGLSMNPLVRKPGEIAGVFNFRAWQSVFPETDLLDAFARSWWKERNPEGFNIEAWLEDKVLNLIGSDFSVQDRIAQGFNQYVQMEMAEQALRGEPVDRDAAVKKIQDYYAVRTVLGFFAGLYVRRMTPSDEQLYNLIDEMYRGTTEYQDLTPEEQRAVNLFRRRKMDPVAYDAYVERMPIIEAYYRTGSYDKAQEFAQRHPEVIPYTDPAWRGKPYADSYPQTVALVIDTDAAMKMYDLVDRLDVADDVRRHAETAFVSRELRKFWAKNDTPAQIRDKMLRAAYFKHLSKLNDTFHAIPEKDYDAKAGFLKEHPILAHWWLQNNDPEDDLKAIINSSNAALRDHYFELLDKKDYGAAKAWLARFPFIFEFTKAADRVVDGKWMFPPGSQPKSQHARDYLRAKAALNQFFALLNGQGKNAAYNWLRGDSPAAALVRWYFARYAHGGHGAGGSSAHARAYLAAKKGLDVFFSILEKQGKQAAFDWLDKKGDLQEIVRAYFKRWGSHHTDSPKARAYLAAKPGLDRFFAILERDGKQAAFDWLDKHGHLQRLARRYFDQYGHHDDTPKSRAFLHARTAIDRYFGILKKQGKQAAFDWLDQDGAQQKLVRDYFFEFGDHGTKAQTADFVEAKAGLKHYYELLRHDKNEALDWLRSDNPDAQKARAYFKKWSKMNQLARKWGDFVSSENPEINQRLKFWQRYWQLPPDQRMNFVLNNAEDSGVFVYGPIGETQRHNHIQRYLRDALQHHISEKNALYLRIKPLLDLYFTLKTPADKALMLKANPDVKDYLDRYSSRSVTGDKKLDAQIAAYFKFDRGSQERTDYLESHPQLRRYFNKKSTPAERAIHAALEAYFAQPYGDRKVYLLAHPEIQAYFDKRRAEADAENKAASAFDLADPRLTKFFEEAERTITEAGLAKQEQLSHRKVKPLTLDRRVDRIPTQK